MKACFGERGLGPPERGWGLRFGPPLDFLYFRSKRNMALPSIFKTLGLPVTFPKFHIPKSNRNTPLSGFLKIIINRGLTKINTGCRLKACSAIIAASRFWCIAVIGVIAMTYVGCMRGETVDEKRCEHRWKKYGKSRRCLDGSETWIERCRRCQEFRQVTLAWARTGQRMKPEFYYDAVVEGGYGQPASHRGRSEALPSVTQ